MPAFNFKEQFVEPIRSGIKHHTIRDKRKDGRLPAKRGDPLSLFCGMRTKNCFRILPDTVPCTGLQSIQINPILQGVRVWVGDTLLSPDECERLAIADGFNDFATMMKFWDGRLPFDGYIIHWQPKDRRI
jgi:hypothetical protein